MDKINRGPTVAEYCDKRITSLNEQIQKLRDQRDYYFWLWEQYKDSKLLYSEYVVDRAEPYQNKPL